MKFLSTRGKAVVDNGAMAIAKGLANDGGLFVPETFPSLKSELKNMLTEDYATRAFRVIGSFLPEYDKEELLNACKTAYSSFDEGDAAPVVKIDDDSFILELFHGPTLAFKDIALTLLPHLLRKGSDISGVKEQILILVATSGDTGKAALSGFCDKEGIKIMVFYPSDGVSDMQKLQMTTQEGNNVNVVGVKGNFDDCQTAVKKIFSDVKFNEELKKNNVVLSSANSINFGRLVPQIAYYFSAYLDLVSSNEIKLGDKINFVVPTGNFGNILAGYYAYRMGLPVEKLICASNSNNVLTDFFLSGNYDKNREFFKTASPSMDILVSSNLERLLFELSGRDCKITEERMSALKNEGKYSITERELKSARQNFSADFCSEEECFKEISEFFDEYGYVLDTHTAVAENVARKYKENAKKDIPTVVLSTASPYKFPQNVYKAITGKNIEDAFTAAKQLSEISAMDIPKQISELKSKKVRFAKVSDKDNLKEEVLSFVKKN